MNIYFGYYPELYFGEGGLQTQINETKRALERKGINVYHYYEYNPKTSPKIDVYHQFSVEPSCKTISEFFVKNSKANLLSTVFNHGFKNHEVVLLKLLNQLPGNYFNIQTKKNMFFSFDHHVFLGHKERLKCNHFFGKSNDYTMIPNGLTCSTSMLSDEKGEYLVHIANIYPLKNQSYAIDLAYAMGLKLILIGDIRDKAYYDLCLNKAQEKCVNIEHVGFLDNSSITFKRIVAEAKFTIIPSFNEVLPLVAFESLMLGTQVICTNNCSIDDYLDYECGVLTFDPLQPASNLVQEATKFLEYPHDFHVIQNLLSHEYSWDGVADKLISIYEKLLSR